MFILYVCIVFMNLTMIRTEEDIVRIDIKAGQQNNTCDVLPEVNLHAGKKFTLQVRSDYFIKESSWNHKGSKQHLQDLENSTFSITYKRTKSSGKQNNTCVYTYSHTGKAGDISGGKWIFKFKLLKNYDPWFVPQNKTKPKIMSCSTDVQIGLAKPKGHHSTTSEALEARSSPGGEDKYWLIILVSVLGMLLLVQSSFIIFGRVRSCKSNRNNDEDPISPKSPKVKHGSKRRTNIADRPPLPLPFDEVVREEPMPPVSPISPVPKRHIYPPASAPPMPLDNSYNGPPGGPLVPKQSYRNKALDNSEEELRTPSFARRRLEAKLAQLPPKGVAASKPFKLPKPAPPLHPKNLQVFPPPAPCQRRSIVDPDPRLSDEDWQYEKLQPASKYLDNFNNTPYNIL